MTNADSFTGFLPLQQIAPYAAAAAAMGARVTAHQFDAGRALAVERGRLRLILRGPVWADGVSAADQRRSLRKLARWPGLTIATPEAAMGGFGLVPLVMPLFHAIWSLGPDLRKSCSGKWRNKLIQSEKTGIRVQPGGPAAMARLLQEDARQRRERGYQGLPLAFSEHLPTDALRLWEWRQAGELHAAMVFVVHDMSATYHLGWASETARRAGVHAVMLMTAATALCAEGVRWLDLGSVDTDRAPGLARFKLGTGAVLKPLGPTVLVLP